MSKEGDALCRRLGYVFRDPSLLERALTHRSKGGEHNERLEFLGDSVLNLVISAELYERFPRQAEGALTRLRASLVRKPALAALARRIDLGPCIELGGGELKSGGWDRDSILGDTLEAVFGAIFRDGGFEAATRVILALYDDELAHLDPSIIPKDPKTQLQEYLQKRSLPTPAYDVVEISGEPHNQLFVVECRLAEPPHAVRGEGNSRRAAEQQAAERALAILTSS